MNISVCEYKELCKNKNGIYSREDYVKEKFPKIYSIIIESTIDTKFNERVYMFLNDMNHRPKCLYCNDEVKFKSKTIGYQKFCSNSCSTKGSKEVVAKKIFENWGVNHPSLLPHNIEKRKLKKIESIKIVIKENGKFIDYNFETDIFTLLCNDCGKTHYTSYEVLRQRKYLGLSWKDCITSAFNTSSVENELRKFIQDEYNGVILFNDKKTLSNNKEIDIYLPTDKIAFEFNGIWWHNELNKPKRYHYNKWNECENLGISLIQIYEDDWKFKNKIVKSRIRNILGITKNKIYARNCDIKRIIDLRHVESFLIENHLQGSIKSSHNFGLYYNGELVSIMTFENIKEEIYEMVRFCNKVDLLVIGSAYRLFEYFIKLMKPDEIVSYSHNEWPEKIYYEIGMDLECIKEESYWYVENEVRKNEIKKDSKIIRIWGSGQKKFIWKK
jgi:hypothetical protein